MLEVILILLVLLVWLGWVQPWMPRFVINKKNIPDPIPQRASDLHCRVALTGAEDRNNESTAFEVNIRGLVSAPSDKCEVDVQVLIADVAQDLSGAKPVLSSVRQFQMEDSPAFCFRSHIGNLPNRQTVLSNWTPIAKIRADLLRFPRKGKRTLKFVTSVISVAGERELACGVATIDYQNNQAGYIDARENQQRSEILTARLAGVFCRSAGKVNESAAGVVTDWIGARIKSSANKDDQARRRAELEKSLQNAFESSEAKNQSDINATGRQMAETATIIERYEAMELCLQTARAAGRINQEHIDVLGTLANLLRVDPDKFLAMVQKILPLEMYEKQDVRFILGITSDMSPEEVRRQLNHEYRKWNARVTHPDPATRAQAGRMLTLIAEVRAGYPEQKCTACSLKQEPGVKMG